MSKLRYQDNKYNDIIKVLNDTQVDVIGSVTNTYPFAKDIFMSDSTMTIPYSKYDALDIKKVEQNIILLEQTDIEKNSLELWQYTMLEDLLKYNLERNKFVFLNYNYNLNNTENKKRIKQEFYKYDKILYGYPDMQEFLCILSHTLKKINPDLLDYDEAKMYNELLSLLPEIPDSTNEIFRPSNNVLKRFHERAVDYYSHFLKYIPEKEIFDLKEICKIVDEILNKEYTYSKGSWKVVYDEKRSFANVDQYKREISFPGRRNIPYYTRDKLVELIIHEVGVHFLRELPFDNVEFESLRTGLRGYETIEEGIAICLSQAVTNSFAYSGLIHYITIGLAYFYDLNFRDVYEIQRRLQYLAYKTPYGRSYDSVNRAFRGTYQLVNFKDLAYYNGTIKIWNYISDHIEDPLLFDNLLLSGKTDIFNTNQQMIIREFKKIHV